MAEEGDVDGSMVKVAEAEALQQKWKELHESYTQPDRTMSVCEICGVFVQSTDNEQRRLVRSWISTAVSLTSCMRTPQLTVSWGHLPLCFVKHEVSA